MSFPPNLNVVSRHPDPFVDPRIIYCMVTGQSKWSKYVCLVMKNTCTLKMF